METVVIVGGGHAAAEAAFALRAKKYGGSITMVSSESRLPYHRPPLSKGFLTGALDEAKLDIKKPEMYQKFDIKTHLNTSVTRINLADQQILTNEMPIDYDHLILATGTRPRQLDCVGSDLPCVSYLRTIEDVEKIRKQCRAGTRVLIVGAGYIGLEVAASVIKVGGHACVLEFQERVLSRVTNQTMSEFYQNLHAKHGVDIKLQTALTKITSSDNGYIAHLSDESQEVFDLIVVGIGVVPNDELAKNAGIECENGILVDKYTRTNFNNVYAIGDVSMHPNQIYGRNIRLESVPNAMDQAKVAASNICGLATEYNSVPWFWSDQYNIKLQTAGLSQGYDQTLIRGDMTKDSFSILYLQNGKLIALDAINSPQDFMRAKQLIATEFYLTHRAIDDPSLDWFTP